MSDTSVLEEQIANLSSKYDEMKSDYNESLDTIWMLLAALLVFFMHAGFSMLEAGSVREKNTQGILGKNMLVVTVGFLAWYIMGFSLAFGERDDPNKFIGGSGFAMDGFWDDKSYFRNWFFQGAFCATGATIVSGAMAERTATVGFGIYTVIMTSFIYPVVVYWGWSGLGFLNYTNDHEESASVFGPFYMDFAGSGIVHLVGGVGALCGAIIVGPRKGRFDNSVPEDEFFAHNVPFVVLATFFLWFGWYGFNPGSTLSMHDSDTANVAGLVAVNTTLSPCVAGLTVFLLRAKVFPPHRKDVGGFCNGILAGLVAITAGCGVVKHWEAIVIGFIGAWVYQIVSMLLKYFKIDDVVDAVPVHGACGIWGVLALGLFGDPDHGMGGNGFIYGGDQLRVQSLAVIIIVAWSGFLSTLIFLPLRVANLLRLSDTYQDEGADAMEHSPPKAYESHEAHDVAKEAPEDNQAEA